MRPRLARTPEQIEEQLRERVAELKAIADSPAMVSSCWTCKWADDYEAAWCHQPLVVGFGDKFHMGAGRQDLAKRIPDLCGPEKALYEPRMRWWARFWRWLTG